MFIFDLLEQSNIDVDKILIVDADTIVHPNSPNFFDIAEDKFCVVNNIGSYDWLFRSVENYKKYIFNDYNFDVTKYYNSGVLILNKNHKEFFNNIKKNLAENGVIILQEQIFASGPKTFEKFITDGGLKIQDAYWEPKNCADNMHLYYLEVVHAWTVLKKFGHEPQAI